MAYENGSLIDSREGTFTVIQTPTPTPLPPETASIKGTILDAVTNNPVVGAEVIIVSKTYDKQYPTAVTDEYGSFKLDKMYPDKYSITVKATGYKPAYLDLDRIDGDQVLSDIKLEKYVAATTTPTPSPEPSAVQGWLNLLTSPQACVAFISSTVAVIVSLTVIYEWLQRQKERRKKEGQ
nr:carboxypeptidase-like regulatory domain-containing protein [Methanocella sp. CWC-04]